MMINDYLDILKETDRKKYDEIINKYIKKLKASVRKLATIFPYLKSTINRIKNNLNSLKTNKNNEKIYSIIKEEFEKHKRRYGKRQIQAILFKKYHINLSDRQIGRIKNKLDLKCTIRNKRKIKEVKNTNYFVENIVARDYDNKNHKETIAAIDVTFIEKPMDVLNQNHVYCSVILNHRTKEIISYKLSLFNDTELAINTIKDINLKNVIIHSDHASAYTSESFLKVLNEKQWIQSMSRIGNSLDNREIEYLFSIFKTELIYQLDMSKITFKQLEKLIDEYVYYYNNVRIQKKLGWKAPSEV